MKLVPDHRIGNLRVEHELGRGRHAAVYRVWDTVLDRTALLKVVARDAQGSDAALREARRLGGLRHEHIPALYAIHTLGDDHWGLEMEHVAGGTLRDLLDTRGRLTSEAAVPVLAGVLRALEAAHGHDVHHGDIRAARVLLGSDGAVKLTDFGRCGRSRRAAGRPAGVPPGALHGLAPECLAGCEPTVATDLWSVGVLAYRMLGGRPPFQGETLSEFVAAVHAARPASLGPQVPSLLDAWVRWMLARQPSDRPASARAARHALLRAEGHRTHARRARRAAQGRETLRNVVAGLLRAGAAEEAGRKDEARRLAHEAQVAAADLGRSWMLKTTQAAWQKRRARAPRAG